MAVKSFRDLVVWQRGIAFAEKIYRLSHDFPKHETYGLTNQLRRAAVSIPSNIAEGHERDSTKEYLHHLSYATGSLAEVETLVVIASRLEYLPQNQIETILRECDELERMIHAIQRSLKARDL
jgi:four helix bundle protein